MHSPCSASVHAALVRRSFDTARPLARPSPSPRASFDGGRPATHAARCSMSSVDERPARQARSVAAWPRARCGPLLYPRRAGRGAGDLGATLTRGACRSMQARRTAAAASSVRPVRNAARGAAAAAVRATAAARASRQPQRAPARCSRARVSAKTSVCGVARAHSQCRLLSGPRTRPSTWTFDWTTARGRRLRSSRRVRRAAPRCAFQASAAALPGQPHRHAHGPLCTITSCSHARERSPPHTPPLPPSASPRSAGRSGLRSARACHAKRNAREVGCAQLTNSNSKGF